MEAVKVVVRVRPLNQTEKGRGNYSIIQIDREFNQCTITNPKTQVPKTFAYDSVYDEQCPQQLLYDETAFPLVESVIQGYNGTIFAYGQTGCGKTYTMVGVNDPPELRGIIPNSFSHVFSAIAEAPHEKCFLVRCSYCEIYNEEIRDLLHFDPNMKLELKENKDNGIFVKNLSMHTVKSVDGIEQAMAEGNTHRITKETQMNERSSRSHAIFTIYIESSEEIEERQIIKAGKLNLVDLAGSERQKKTGVAGDTLKEAIEINLSLSALGNVISALVDGSAKHIPYRDSKLTRLLQDSLGGNTKTVMIAVCSPADYNYDESLSTLRYASRAKFIQNKPKVNEDPKDALLRQYAEEIEKLKKMLQERSSGEPIIIEKIVEKEKIVEREKIVEVEAKRKRKKRKKAPKANVLESDSEEEYPDDFESSMINDRQNGKSQSSIDSGENTMENEIAKHPKKYSKSKKNSSDLQMKDEDTTEIEGSQSPPKSKPKTKSSKADLIVRPGKGEDRTELEGQKAKANAKNSKGDVIVRQSKEEESAEIEGSQRQFKNKSKAKPSKADGINLQAKYEDATELEESQSQLKHKPKGKPNRPDVASIQAKDEDPTSKEGSPAPKSKPKSSTADLIISKDPKISIKTKESRKTSADAKSPKQRKLTTSIKEETAALQLELAQEDHGQKEEDMEKMIQEIQLQLIAGGEQLDKAEKERLKAQRDFRNKLKKQKQKEKALAEENRKKEEEMLMKEKEYQNLQEEVDDLRKVIMKLRLKYKSSLAEIEDLNHEHEIEKEGLLETIRSKERETDFLHRVFEFMLPPNELQKIRQRSRWDDDNHEWKIPAFVIQQKQITFPKLPKQQLREIVQNELKTRTVVYQSEAKNPQPNPKYAQYEEEPNEDLRNMKFSDWNEGQNYEEVNGNGYSNTKYENGIAQGRFENDGRPITSGGHSRDSQILKQVKNAALEPIDLKSLTGEGKSAVLGQEISLASPAARGKIAAQPQGKPVLKPIDHRGISKEKTMPRKASKGNLASY
ncbi:unnamed protein product [Blepharisma stoltei]|uniref:Kinesin motor domain-containing protein n=1 Tax=Blepharisma stoltei TaxID=1481888 RepID=A0AAU9IND2_9CILI|nr:unnamed protein product [Blepharisma stoltei]